MTRVWRRDAAFHWAAALVTAALIFCTISAHAAPRVHLDLDVELDPGERRLHARAEFSAMGEFTFALHSSLTVWAASADGRAVNARIVESSGEFRRWEVTVPRGANLRIEYGGTLPALDRSLDHRGVLRARGPMAAVEGSFLPAGSGWYPEPARRFSYRVRLRLPGNQRGLVAGRLASESLPGASGRYEGVFEFDQPAEGIDLMAGPYTVRERMEPREGRPPLRLRTYFYADLDPLAEHYLEDSARYIRLYSSEIGDYPFDGFSVIASPLPTGFGMPTLTYIGRDVLKLPFIRATSLGHEVLHNWWGNGVYVDYATGNWSEGLTTFMADYFYKERESGAAAREMRLAWLRDFAAVPDGAHRPLSAFRSRTHGAEAVVGYGKAAMVFFMLRDELGEPVFRAGIRLFWKAYRFNAASWDDLRRAFEGVSGRSLATFFEQWIHRSGGPELQVMEARRDGGNALALTVVQSMPAYALSVPVELVAAGRNRDERISVNRERTVVGIAADAAVEGVRLDPDFRLWRRLDPETLPPILRHWIVARAPRLAIVSTDREAQRAAQAIAQRFFERPATIFDSANAHRLAEPVLIVGLSDDVERALAMWQLPPQPANIADRGSAQVWAVRGRAHAPVAVISGRDPASLIAVARSLPHYGAQSYLVYDGARVIERGVWPAVIPTVPVTHR